MIQVPPRARWEQILENILGFCAVSGSRPESTASGRSCRRRRIVREVIEERFRMSGLGLRTRPNSHDKRQFIAKCGKLRCVRFLVRACRIELQESISLIGEARPRPLYEFLSRCGLKEERSFVFVRSAEQRHIILFALGEYRSTIFRQKPPPSYRA